MTRENHRPFCVRWFFCRFGPLFLNTAVTMSTISWRSLGYPFIHVVSCFKYAFWNIKCPESICKHKSNNQSASERHTSRLKPANTDTTPTQPHRNTNTSNQEHTTNVVIQQNSHKLLMMDILMSETCWAHKKWNKNSKWHQVGLLFSAITMMHGPINIISKYLHVMYII